MTAHVAWTAADIARGLSDPELEEKFANLTRDVLTEPRRRDLIETLWHVDRHSNVSLLVDKLAV